jgi:DNA polymerase sigma
MNENNIKNNNKNNSNSQNKKNNKKREKSPSIFFLFDTVKNKNKKKPKSKSPNNIKSEINDHFAISFISSNNKSLNINTFYEKLHNNILKNDKKVDNILQSLTKIKNYCIEEIKNIIKITYDDIRNYYSIDLYGSFTTGLMIEASDIDIRIKINECKKKDFEKYFFSLYNKLKDENKFENIIPISTANVPVIKLLLNIEKFIASKKDLEKDFSKFKQLSLFKNFIFDKKELLQIKIDITFIINYYQNNNNEIFDKFQNDKLNINNSINNNNEISSISYVKKQMEEYPEIKPVLRLLKRYFYIKKMNSCFEGGLSSYSLFLLILSFAKYQKIFNVNQNKIINLGIFLIQFLEFFGKIFDFKNHLININSPYIYEINNNISYKSGKTLIILDPLTGLNASKSSYKIGEIQKMFINGLDFFEKERIVYENELIKEKNDKRDNDKNNNFEVILGLTKIQKNDYFKKNKKDNKNCLNIIDKFFAT